jgi:hypothetical protein
MTNVCYLAALTAATIVTPQTLFAQSAEALARQTQNPVASLISVPLQANWDVGIGERETTGVLLNIQPVMPFVLTKEWNVILRVIVPMTSQPSGSDARINGLGDVVTTAFLSPVKSGRVVWGVGPVVLLPTATDNALGAEKIGLGPSVVALVQPDKWTLGILFNQIWSVDGANDREDVNQTLLQPFANYNLGNGLSVGVSTEAVSNWEADEDKWTAPLIFSVSKVALLGKRPVNIQAAIAPYVASRPGGADWRARFAVTFLFPR